MLPRIRFLTAVLCLWPALAPADPAPKFRFLSGHGLALGQGRAGARGPHALDSVSVSFRQYPGPGRCKENLSVETDTDLRKNRLQSGDAGASLQYRLSGFTVGGDAGVTYATILYDKSSRVEKVKAEAAWDFRYGLSLGKTIAWDADSTWETALRAGYDEYGGAFRTWSGSAALGKTWGDVEVGAEATGFRQLQDTDETYGFGASLASEWDPGDHRIAIRAGLDWLPEPDPQRTLILGFGYAYSVTDWLEAGIFALRESDLDAAAPVKGVKDGNSASRLYRAIGASLSLSF